MTGAPEDASAIAEGLSRNAVTVVLDGMPPTATAAFEMLVHVVIKATYTVEESRFHHYHYH
jgi:hypothetical protein